MRALKIAILCVIAACAANAVSIWLAGPASRIIDLFITAVVLAFACGIGWVIRNVSTYPDYIQEIPEPATMPQIEQRVTRTAVVVAIHAPGPKGVAR